MKSKTNNIGNEGEGVTLVVSQLRKKFRVIEQNNHLQSQILTYHNKL